MDPAEKSLCMQVIESYAEGGSIVRALDWHKLSTRKFYRAINHDSELMTEYRAVMMARGHIAADEVVLMADNVENPARARNMMDARKWRASVYDRQSFGDHLDMTIDQTVSVSGALEAAKRRALQPRRNLDGVLDAEVTDIPRLSAPSATDKQSVGPAITPDPAVNPFDD